MTIPRPALRTASWPAIGSSRASTAARSGSEENGVRPGPRAPADRADGGSPPSPRVAILGAGPAGLVIAKYAADAGLAPTLFDRCQHVGGAWSPQNMPRWPTFRANLSRLACQFSSHPWDDGAPLFPAQAEVGRYLQGYFDDEVASRSRVVLGAEIHAVTATTHGWDVRWQHPGEATRHADFDFVVVATGFFAQARVPSAPLQTFRGAVIHSADYRDSARFADQRVVVVGGSFSAADVAADVARNAREVVNLVPRPFWVLPRFVAGTSAAAFEPLDLLLYSRESRSQPYEQPPRTAAQHLAVNNFLADLGASPVAAARADLARSAAPVAVVVSDTYAGMLRVNRVAPVAGRLAGASVNRVHLDDGRCIDDVDAIVLCSGYGPDLAFFDQQTRGRIDFRRDDLFLPLALDSMTWHPNLPRLGFVGMYRGPYFGVMEMQARCCAAHFSRQVSGADSPAGRGPFLVEQAARLRALTPRPPFPYPDYVGIMQGFADALGSSPSASWAAAHPMLLPTDFGGDQIRARGARQADAVVQAAERGRFVAGAVFRSLVGAWEFYRTITSAISSAPSGDATGTATFLPDAVPGQLQYAEHGIFTDLSRDARRHEVTQRYLYQHADEAPSIVVRRQGHAAENELLHTFGFVDDQVPPEPRPAGQWSARAELTCGQDQYSTRYQFSFVRQDVTTFRIEHRVRGPKKDYVSDTTFTRQAAGAVADSARDLRPRSLSRPPPRPGAQSSRPLDNCDSATP